MSYQTVPNTDDSAMASPPYPTRPAHTSSKYKVMGALAATCVLGLGLSGWVNGSAVPTEGSKRNDVGIGSMDVCTTGSYSKTTLKPAGTWPFISLFPDTRGAKKFEGSDVIYSKGMFYAIADSLWSILAVDTDMQIFSAGNKMIGDPFREADESGYEGLFIVDDVFFIVRESIENADGNGNFHAIVEEVVINEAGDDYDVVRQCVSNYKFQGDSKGFEGAVGMKDSSGNLFMLGLCEGNHCMEGKEGKDRGNGKVIVMEKTVTGEGVEDCEWNEVRTLVIPKSAFFQDYSAISVTDDGKVAITSQEESAMWVGHLNGWESSIDDLSFGEKSKTYNFPRDDNCRMTYCNIEGIHWIGNDQVVAVSDKMKSKGKQDFRCFDNDQSIHIFSLPA